MKIKPLTPSAAQELVLLGRKIRDREMTLDQLRGQALGKTCELLAEAALQGNDLMKAKKLIPHGQWLPWLGKNFQKSERTAQAYMRIAANPQRVADLTSLRQGLEAVKLLEAGEAAEGSGSGESPRSWPFYQEGILRFSKITKFVQANPLDKWPEESRERLGEMLLPIAQKLWPEKFTAETPRRGD